MTDPRDDEVVARHEGYERLQHQYLMEALHRAAWRGRVAEFLALQRLPASDYQAQAKALLDYLEADGFVVCRTDEGRQGEDKA